MTDNELATAARLAEYGSVTARMLAKAIAEVKAMRQDAADVQAVLAKMPIEPFASMGVRKLTLAERVEHASAMWWSDLRELEKLRYDPAALEVQALRAVADAAKSYVGTQDYGQAGWDRLVKAVEEWEARS